jgi:hypothetical protein
MDNSLGVGRSRENENFSEIIGNFGPVLEIIKLVQWPPAAADSSEVLVLLEKEVIAECERVRRVEAHSFPPTYRSVQVEEKECGIHLVKKQEL